MQQHFHVLQMTDFDWSRLVLISMRPDVCATTLPVCLKQTKERVKLLIQLADGFCDKGHAHAVEIKKWVASVDKRYRDFSMRMDKYRGCLESALGISSDSNKAVSHPRPPLALLTYVSGLFYVCRWDGKETPESLL